MYAAVQDIIDSTPPGAGGFIRVHCPFCEELGHRSNTKNLAINPENGWFKCWRAFECQTHGILHSAGRPRTNDAYLVRPEMFTVTSVREAMATARGEAPAPPPSAEKEPVDDVEGYTQLDPAVPLRGTAHLRYLIGRGVHPATITEVGIGYASKGKYEGRLVVPFHDGTRYAGSVTRSLESSKRAYLNTPKFKRGTMFNMGALSQESEDPVAIVEGIFDALPHWPFAVACLGKPTTEQIDLIARLVKRPVVLMLDPDARSENFAAQTRLMLRGLNVRRVDLPPPYDPGNLTISQFMDYLFGDT